jgi:hypothetical protein
VRVRPPVPRGHQDAFSWLSHDSRTSGAL